MTATGYEKQQEELFLRSFNGIEAAGGNKDFASSPSAHWFDWAFHMTEGDMSGYLNMTRLACDAANGNAERASGVYASLEARPQPVAFSERYKKEIDLPFPYAIRIYETGEAEFELYLAYGGSETVKFYGKVDKVPIIALNP
jgi:hypothetical protein